MLCGKPSYVVGKRAFHVGSASQGAQDAVNHILRGLRDTVVPCLCVRVGWVVRVCRAFCARLAGLITHRNIGCPARRSHCKPSHSCSPRHPCTGLWCGQRVRKAVRTAISRVPSIKRAPLEGVRQRTKKVRLGRVIHHLALALLSLQSQLHVVVDEALRLGRAKLDQAAALNGRGLHSAIGGASLVPDGVRHGPVQTHQPPRLVRRGQEVAG